MHAVSPLAAATEVKKSDTLQLVFLATILVAATLAAYQPAWNGELLWDDDAHVTPPNLRLTEGLTRIWFDLGATQQYYPLLHSAFWVQYRLWGDDTFGYHLVNIILHTLCAFLILLILRHLSVPGAALAAFIFALHPVHVESVAWISEQKNTLSGLFYLCSALAYLAFDDGRKYTIYASALLLFVLALLTKTVTASLPAALLVVFWWQRGRISWRTDVRPLLPFFVLGATGGLLTAWVERTYVGAHGADYNFTAVERCMIAGRAIWFYLSKLFWPADLSFVYPRWEISQANWWQLLYPLGVMGLLVLLWKVRIRWRAPLAAMLFFCGTLFPALGFFDVFPFRFSFVADHFQYLASLGIISLVAAGVVLTLQRWKMWPGPAAWVVSVLLASILGILTWRESRLYANAETLYRTTLDRNPGCWLAQNNLGAILLQEKRYDEAVGRLKDALRLRNDDAVICNNLGMARASQNELPNAIEFFERAINHDPNLVIAHINLANALYRLGRFEESANHCDKASKLKPKNAEDCFSLAELFVRQGRIDDAETQFKQALQLDPGFAAAHFGLGDVLTKQERHEGANVHYREALRLDPDHAEFYLRLGDTLQSLGKVDEAIARYQEAVRIKPDYVDALDNLGIVLQAAGRHEEAAERFRDVLKFEHDSAEALLGLGMSLFALGRADDAIAHLEHAVRIKPDYSDAHGNLGMVLHSLGRFEQALAHYQQAVTIKPDFANAHNNLARLLATCPDRQLRDGQQAVAHAKRAVEVSGDYNYLFLDTLAAAYSETGNFQKAANWQAEAVELAPAREKQAIQERLDLYRSKIGS